MPQLEKIWLCTYFILHRVQLYFGVKIFAETQRPEPEDPPSRYSQNNQENNLAHEQMCLVEADFPHM